MLHLTCLGVPPWLGCCENACLGLVHDCISPSSARLYWQQMLEAVQTIHDEKIIHRLWEGSATLHPRIEKLSAVLIRPGRGHVVSIRAIDPVTILPRKAFSRDQRVHIVHLHTVQSALQWMMA